MDPGGGTSLLGHMDREVLDLNLHGDVPTIKNFVPGSIFFAFKSYPILENIC